MGKKTSFTLKILAASLFTMLLVAFLFTDSIGLVSFGGDEAVDTSSLEDGVYTGSGDGYNGPIEVEVTVENGEITNVDVLSHEDSPGISDPAFEEVPAAIVDNNSTEVDTVSGATFSSEGIMAAVNNALSGEAGEATGSSDEAEDEETEDDGEAVVPADTEYPDGTYEATVEGHNGPLTVVVTVEGNVITDVEVTEHEETEGLSDPAIEEVPAAIVASNSTDVDVVSGATVTSEAIIAAVEEALGNEDGAEAEEGPVVKAASYVDGTYEGTAEAHNGPLSVSVTITDGEIAEVTVTEHEETEGLADPALEEVPAAIVENNSTEVEVVSGATYASEAIMEAVDQALLEAAIAYEVTVEGHNDPLTVIVELADDNSIVSVEVTEHEETEGLADPAIEEVPAAIVENNATEVEVVSGATVTSEAIIEAVNLILETVN